MHESVCQSGHASCLRGKFFSTLTGFDVTKCNPLPLTRQVECKGAGQGTEGSGEVLGGPQPGGIGKLKVGE